MIQNYFPPVLMLYILWNLATFSLGMLESGGPDRTNGVFVNIHSFFGPWLLVLSVFFWGCTYSEVYRAAIIFALLFIIATCAAGYLAWQHYFHPAQPVTVESQQQAEAPEGVEIAAKNAHINMLQSQLEDAAKQIASLYNRPPDTVIKTVPVEVVKTVEVEREKREADFAIVTDAKQQDKQVDLKQVEKLPADTLVTLNQYNVFAYKQKLRQIELTPDWSEMVRRKFVVDEVSYGESRKISNDGKYIGWKIGYSIKHGEVKMAIIYTF